MEVRERGKEIINNESDIVFFKSAESYSNSLAVKNYCLEIVDSMNKVCWSMIFFV